MQPSIAALRFLELRIQPIDLRLDTFPFHGESRDLGVAGGDGRVRRGQLAGEPVTLGGGIGPAAGQLREADGQILSLPVDGLVGRLQGGVLGGHLLQLLDPGGMLVGNAPKFGDLAFQGGRSTAMAAELLFRLLEQLLISFQHPPLLAMRLKELGQVLAEAVLDRMSLVELHLEGTTVGRDVRRTPSRGGRRWGGRL